MRIARLLSILLIAISAFADSLETTAPVAVISPFTYWSASPRSGRFYRPTGVKVGSKYFLYVQGGAYKGVTTGPGSETCGTIGEKALAFSAPWTSAGLRSQFTYERAVSPCNPADDVHYQTGAAFVSSTDGKVKLTIDETETGSDPRSADFKRILLGSSTDGKNFTWTTFVKQSVINSVTYSISQANLVQATANSNWWGVFQWAYCTLCNGTDGIGFWNQGRMRVVMDPANVRGYVVYLLMSDGATWGQVNDDGSFNFIPYNTFYGGARSIVNNNNTWEAWTILGGTPNGGCDDGDPNSSSSFGYYTVSQGGSFGAIQYLTSSSRAMPTMNGTGRLDPFRMQDMNGKRLLYSASTDHMCQTTGNDGFRGMEILVTEVNN
jgi:hypothetical protein